ncbi:Protein kinase domain protein [Legionella massiliensis]|uniref:Protein kinase domain protein n=1 Tax=Legionella massiliensis TaxID=1034943 RepID=A0A078L0P0_9GAMM|nr:hypothetical protein [Legionella massiliensis]CDZ77573.1 Protein kinase domain protein [Legionella massiliensis]CEE13311.1 Protein kinase domain protein [Legionella massiliensis]
MLSLIPLKGFYLSEKRKQIVKVNYLVNQINHYKKTEPNNAEPFIAELYAYQNELIEKTIAVEPVLSWFDSNPAHKVRKLIREKIREKTLILRIKELFAATNMTDIYYQYTGAASLRNLIQQRLELIGDKYQVINLDKGKTPLVRVIGEHNESFVMRFIQLNSREEAAGTSARFAREFLVDFAPIAKPYHLAFIEDDDHEVSFLECSKYYKNGSLDTLFRHLRKQLASNIELGQLVLLYAQQLFEFFIAINQKNIWYTDLKPSNILLDNNDHLIFNDIKGLVISTTKKTTSNRVHISKEYYSPSVYTRDNRINLERLQRQTLANTLYQLACGQLPIQIRINEQNWENAYEFSQEIFQNKIGDYLKNLINLLNMKKAVPMTKLLVETRDFMANRKNYANYEFGVNEDRLGC